MSVCVCFVCKEDLNKSNKYTNLAKKNVSFWSNKFPTYVLTNNIEEFQKLNCKTIFDNTYFSQFNKFDIINLLQMEYKTVIYLDCDNLFNEFDINLNDISEGIHGYGGWADSWGNLKKLPYFKIWNNHISVSDSVVFTWESFFILNTNNLWDSTYNEIVKLKKVSNLTELDADIDENPHHGPERCEAIALHVACDITGFPLHYNSNYIKIFYDSIRK
jgi:hypothetical protein